MPNKRATIRTYGSFTSIPERTQDRLLARLVLNIGSMRERVLKHDPACAVAHVGGEAVAWAALFRAGCWPRQKHPHVMVYVQREHRRRGIGSSLLARLREKTRTKKDRLAYRPWDRASRAFFRDAM